MMPKATLKHISEKLHISISTVSRALKDHPDIADQTKKKVKELAELLEYEPNTFAIQLRTNASRLIGVIVPEISGFFYHSFISGLEEEASAWGYSLLILQSNNHAEKELANLRLCRMNRAAGILVAISTDTKDLTPFKRTLDAGSPIVFFDKVPDSREFPCVRMDDEQAAMLAAASICDSGIHKLCAIFGEPSLSITRKRLKAFQETFRQHGPEKDFTILHAGSQEEARAITRTLLEKSDRPDGIFAMSDEILAGVMKSVQEARLQIPADISIISISTGFIPKLFVPEITYIETNGYDLGKKSFEILHKCLSNNPPLGETTVSAAYVAGGSMLQS